MTPALDPHERQLLLGPLGGAFGTCPACLEARVRHYCRSCDEFFLTCGCSTELEAHANHRLYLWTPDRGVVALPDFDTLLRGDT